MEKFDIETLKLTAEESHPRFYREFIKKVDDNIWLETSIKLAINIEDDDYKYMNHFGKIHYDYYQIIKSVGMFYGIYKNESDFYRDYFGPYFC